MSFLVVFIFINIPWWDIQCSSKECANITHSLIGLFLAGNIGKVNIQCPPMECANNCTLHNRILDVLEGWVRSETSKLTLKRLKYCLTPLILSRDFLVTTLIPFELLLCYQIHSILGCKFFIRFQDVGGFGCCN